LKINIHRLEEYKSWYLN